MRVLRSCAAALNLAALAALCSPIPASATDPAVGPRHFAPMYPDPPFHFRGTAGMLIRFKTTPEVLKKLVPEPLVPNPDGIMWFYAGRQRTTTLGDYNEAMIGIPASLRGAPGSFVPVVYLDEAVPLSTGRERAGWHKKDARVSIVESDAVVTVTIERGGAVLARASMSRDQPVSPEVLGKVRPSYFVLKVIPSAKPGAPPEVLQLVATAPQNRVVKSGAAGKGTLQLGGSPGDPLDMIPVMEILGATWSVSDFDLAGGEIVHDYLKAPAVMPAAVR
jgi:acetoacetate decarboxylase